MRTTILFFALLFGLSACCPKIAPTIPISKVTPPTTPEIPTLSGTWTLSESASMGGLDRYIPNDVIWDFGKAGSYGEVNIFKKEYIIKSNDSSEKVGIHSYWLNKHILNINSQLYFYSFSDQQLILDSNVNPAISADNFVLTFERTDKPVAVATMEAPRQLSIAYSNIAVVATVYPVNENGEVGECLDNNPKALYEFNPKAERICGMSIEQVRELTTREYKAADLCDCRSQFCGTNETEKFITCLKGKK